MHSTVRVIPRLVEACNSYKSGFSVTQHLEGAPEIMQVR